MNLRSIAKQIAIENGMGVIRGASSAALESAHLSFLSPMPSWIKRFLSKSRHPNELEFKGFLSALRPHVRLIYVSDYRYSGPPVDAQIALGFGRSFAESLGSTRRSIYYATGSSSGFQTEAVAKEVRFVHEAFGVRASHMFRIPERNASVEEQECDRIYLIGNAATRRTFSKPEAKIRLLPGIALQSKNPVPARELMPNRQELLWLGSKGILHKGLHIAAEVASTLSMRLVAVGVRPEEKAIAQEILARSGCEYELRGHVLVGSPPWVELTRRTTFVIGCSVSEGMSTSILTCIAHGLYPITTDTCGIDVGEVVSFAPRKTLVQRLTSALSQALDVSDLELKSRRADLQDYVFRNHSYDHFTATLKNHITMDLT